MVISGFREHLATYSPYVVMEYLSESRGDTEHVNAERLLLSLGYGAYLIDERGHFRETRNVREHIRESREESDNIVFAKPASLPTSTKGHYSSSSASEKPHCPNFGSSTSRSRKSLSTSMEMVMSTCPKRLRLTSNPARAGWTSGRVWTRAGVPRAAFVGGSASPRR